MQVPILVSPQGWIARLANALMVPVMYLVSGTLREAPQETHRWNNRRLKPCEMAGLEQSQMVHCAGRDDPHAVRSPGLVLFHIPLLGGWRNYVVLRPEKPRGNWYAGYQTGNGAGISCLPIMGPVRVLIGSGDVSFFGIDAASGEQLPLKEIGMGRIGEGGPFAKIRLL